MTAQEFIADYAQRSDTTPEDLYERGRVVVTCGPDQRCDYPACKGWAVVSWEAFEEDGDFYNWTLALPPSAAFEAELQAAARRNQGGSSTP